MPGCACATKSVANSRLMSASIGDAATGAAPTSRGPRARRSRTRGWWRACASGSENLTASVFTATTFYNLLKLQVLPGETALLVLLLTCSYPAPLPCSGTCRHGHADG